jgi:hypothetical protein
MDMTVRFSALNWSGFIFQEVLIVVQSGCGGWYKNARNLRNGGRFGQQPQELWTNGDRGRIQRIKKVLK